MICIKIAIIVLLASFIAGCDHLQNETIFPATPVIPGTSTILPTSTTIQTTSPPQLTPTSPLSKYAFPTSIAPAKEYLFYLHGKIIEDQGLPAIDPNYGEYEYQAILEKLAGYGFVVISEPRPKNTDSGIYAQKITRQVKALLQAGVPPKHITVVGASKGAGITILVSQLVQNKDVNYVIMAICDPATVADLKQNGIILYGNVLSIYDYKDDLAGSCDDLFSFSEGKGLSQHDEIVLKVGTGHGVLYKPLDEWITPIVQWARKP
jgi:hypothetical protein